MQRRRRAAALLSGVALVLGLFVNIGSAEAAFTITHTCTPLTAKPGSIVTCTVNVNNGMPATTQWILVNVNDTLYNTNPSLVAASLTTNLGSCIVTNNEVEILCGNNTVTGGINIPQNQTVTVTYKVEVPISAGPSQVFQGPGTSSERHQAATATNLLNILTYTLAPIEPATIQTPACSPGFGPFNVPKQIVGTNGDDVICGSPYADVIGGMGGNDIIYGFGGDDVLFGHAGNDIINGGDGSGDRADGTTGTDTCVAVEAAIRCD